MSKSVYSHAFFVGYFNGQVTPEQLSQRNWERVSNKDDYSWICSMYYKGHVDAMLDANANRPSFLQEVCHYKLAFEETDSQGGKVEGKRLNVPMKKNKGKVSFNYAFRLLNLHFYFFPLGMVFLAIEIDDTGNELDDLTAAHSELMFCETYEKAELKSVLDSLSKFLPDGKASFMLGMGNKFKLYQTIGIDSDEIDDSLLYELGTSSPIGCVKSPQELTPSESYYKGIISTNMVAPFNDWKGLALMDSFSVVSKREQNELQQYFKLWNTYYFQLIFLRCLFEKTFCFSRNISYRMNENTCNLSKDIAQMERYYFYDKISYNFLPNLLYEAISKGMELKEEREELSEQIKESARRNENDEKKEEDKRRDYITLGLAVFAAFSATWDCCSIVKDAFVAKETPVLSTVFFFVAILVICVSAYYIFRK